MGEWTQTTCDVCNYESFNTKGRGYYEGSASSATYDGWAVLVRKYMSKPMTLSSGYVLESREQTERLVICKECLDNPEVIEEYRYGSFRADRFDGENFTKKVSELQAKEDAEYEREDAEYEASLSGADASPSSLAPKEAPDA